MAWPAASEFLGFVVVELALDVIFRASDLYSLGELHAAVQFEEMWCTLLRPTCRFLGVPRESCQRGIEQ